MLDEESALAPGFVLLDDESALIPGLVGLLDEESALAPGFVLLDDESALIPGLVVEVEDESLLIPGLVVVLEEEEPAVVAGLSALLVFAWSSGSGAHADKASKTALAIKLLFQIFMVFLLSKIPDRGQRVGPGRSLLPGFESSAVPGRLALLGASSALVAGGVDEELESPGFPAAPLLDEELPVLDGPDAEPEVEPGGVGLEVESVAELAGLSAPLCAGLVLSCPVSQPANANAMTAEAIALLVQMFMIVFPL